MPLESTCRAEDETSGVVGVSVDLALDISVVASLADLPGRNGRRSKGKFAAICDRVCFASAAASAPWCKKCSDGGA